MRELIGVDGVMILSACAERAGSGPGLAGGGLVVSGVTAGLICLVRLLVFAVVSFRTGRRVPGLTGFIFPVLRVIGAVLPGRDGSDEFCPARSSVSENQPSPTPEGRS